jgi:tRNA(Ile)-lysidine synthase
MLSLPPTALRPGDRACCAISGGADSTALLLLVHAANALPKNALGVGLSAVHVNHGLRGAESDGDQAFVEALCARLGVPLHLRRVDTPARVQAQRETVEEAARNLRYQEFRRILESGAATHILTAHTLDDQAETVLMKLLRGAWLEGLGAISPRLEFAPGTVLRPLLEVRRAALREFLKARQQPWREDSSNADEAFTRNRLRHTVLPVLREENPQIDQALANLAELAREDESRWQVELDRLLPQLLLPGKPVRGGGRSNSTAPGEQALAIELDRLRALDPALRRRVVRAAARQLGARLSFEETTRLLTLAGMPPAGVADPTVPTRPGTVLKLSQGLLAERSLRELRLSRLESQPLRETETAVSSPPAS